MGVVEGLTVKDGVRVMDGVSVIVGLGVLLGGSVRVGEGVIVGVGVLLGVSVLVGGSVWVGVFDGVKVFVGMGVLVRVGVRVKVGVMVGVGKVAPLAPLLRLQAGSLKLMLQPKWEVLKLSGDWLKRPLNAPLQSTTMSFPAAPIPSSRGRLKIDDVQEVGSAPLYTVVPARLILTTLMFQEYRLEADSRAGQ